MIPLQAGVAQRMGRGMSGQQHAPTALYPRERHGTHCTGGCVGPRIGLDGCGTSRRHQDSFPDRPARSQSLYRLSYPTHNIVPITIIKHRQREEKLQRQFKYRWRGRWCFQSWASFEQKRQNSSYCAVDRTASDHGKFTFQAQIIDWSWCSDKRLYPVCQLISQQHRAWRKCRK